jgi:hypothetical protein
VILAPGHQRPPHLGVSFVLHHFHTIKPMFDVVAVYNNPRPVPLVSLYLFAELPWRALGWLSSSSI